MFTLYNGGALYGGQPILIINSVDQNYSLSHEIGQNLHVSFETCDRQVTQQPICPLEVVFVSPWHLQVKEQRFEI